MRILYDIVSPDFSRTSYTGIFIGLAIACVALVLIVKTVRKK